MLDPSLRLRRAIHNADALLIERILKSHPSLIHNPDTNPYFTPEPLPGHSKSNTSLHLACALGHHAVVKLLLKLNHEGPIPPTPQQPASISLNETHETPLHVVATAGHAEIAHLLCSLCPSSILKKDVRGRNALMCASAAGHDTVVQILLTLAGPEGMQTLLTGEDVDGNTALHFASMYGHIKVLRTLLAAGADAEKRNGWSWMAVSYSATVQAEVYFKGLVAEIDRRRSLKREAQEKKTGGAVRLVTLGDGEEM